MNADLSLCGEFQQPATAVYSFALINECKRRYWFLGETINTYGIAQLYWFYCGVLLMRYRHGL